VHLTDSDSCGGVHCMIVIFVEVCNLMFATVVVVCNLLLVTVAMLSTLF